MKVTRAPMLCRYLSLFMAAIIIAAVALAGCVQGEQEQPVTQDRETLYQVSTLGALKAGFYDGTVTYDELAEHGGCGLGTFEGLDGEMVALDGDFYQIKMDGKAYEVAGSSITPYALVTFFDEDIEAQPGEGLDYEGLKAFMDGLLPSRNIFYAIKVEGKFEHVQARSVPSQVKPYPPLSEAIAHQAVFEFDNVEGTMVGFWCPSYIGDINASGYHLHFITSDRTAGGHVLDTRLGDVRVYIDETPDFLMQLPDTEEFFEADLEIPAQP
jgi:acetolactate decarboxylase